MLVAFAAGERRKWAGGMRKWAWLMLWVMVLASLPGLAAAETGAMSRKIADRMTPAVNRPYTEVQLKVSINNKTYDLSYATSGTGWFVSPDGILLTNAHVVDDAVAPENDLIVDRVAEFAQAQLGVKTQAQLNDVLQNTKIVEFKREFYVIMPWNEMVPAKVLKTGHSISAEHGDDVAVVQVQKKSTYVTLPVGPSKDLRKGQTVYLLGYPGVANLEGILDQNNPASHAEATFTIGNVSAIDKTVGGRLTPQLNVNANHGSSGGPVLDGNLVGRGLLTFGNPDGPLTVWAVSGELALEFLSAVKVEPSKGRATELYEAALDAFYKNDLPGAQSRLEQLFTVAPELAKLSNIQKILDDIRDGKGGDDGTLSASGGGGGQLGILIGLIALAGVAALGGFFYLRNKKEDPTKPIPEAGVIIFSAGPLSGQQIPLSKMLLIGRDPARARLLLNDPQVSGAHCELSYTAGGVMLKDLASTNGTFVNGTRVQERLLKYGDTVTLGASPYTSFVYVGGAPSQVEGTRALNPNLVPPQPQGSNAAPAGSTPGYAPATAQGASAPPYAPATAAAATVAQAAPQSQQPDGAPAARRVIRKLSVPEPTPQVRFESGPLAGQSIPIQQPVIIGSHPAQAHIVVASPQVSGAHCELHPTPQGLLLVDRGSATGTYLDPYGQQRVAQQVLQPGQRVYLGPNGAIWFVIAG